MRVPVIATNVGGPAEVIADRKNGLLLTPRAPDNWARSISNLIESPALYARIARNGRLRARAFSVEAHAEELRSVYLHVTGRRGAPAVAPEVVPALPAARAAA